MDGGRGRGRGTAPAGRGAAANPKVEQLKQHLKQLGYNMMDVDMIAKKAIADPSAEYKALKVLSHKALYEGKQSMEKDDLVKANSQFAFAYQTRCVCDYLWKHLLGNSGDAGHAAYLQVQRDFGKLAAGKTKLTAQEKETILAKIRKIHD